jgi:biotin carboxylase
MSILARKKLLITGGCRLSEDIITAAKEMGVYTIVADWHDIQTSPAKLVADEHWEENVKDYDRLASLIKRNRVDGIITGFSDSYLVPYAELCERTGLPSYATAHLFAKTIDKALFKKMCKDNDVPVVPEYDMKRFEPSTLSEQNKVIIKPVDNSGSRGIVICSCPEKYHECVAFALAYSEKKQIVIEQYMQMDQISVSYTIQDGVPSLSTINDDILYRTPNTGTVNCGGIYPSKYIDFYLEHIDEKVKDMLVKEGFRNGVLFMQAFCNGKELYFFEMGYRLSGGRHYIFTEHQNQSSSLKQLIHFALTGKMADYKISDRDHPRFSDLCCRLNLIGKSGVISRVEGLDYLRSREEVIYASLLKKAGEEVGMPGTTSTQLLGAYAVVKDYDHYRLLLSDVQNKVKFLDSEGHNLVVSLDPVNYKC